MSETRHAVITDDLVARAKSRIGKVYVPTEPFFNTQATKDAIRHFCDGIGDINPLYRDRTYASKTRYRRLVAPPCFLYSVYWPQGEGGLMPGMHSWHGGNDWEWFLPVLEGDEITYTITLFDLVEKKSRMAGRTFVTYDLVEYRNQRSELIARAKGWCLVAERQASKERGKLKDISRATYTEEEINKIYDDYQKEVVRGRTPRYWEDVQLGEELTPVVKGPLSIRDINCWIMGAGSLYMKAHRRFLDYQERHPKVGMLDSTTGVVDVPVLVHQEATRAGEVGVPGAYDFGPQRISWFGHLLTNWMGDEGFLWKLYVELRRFNLVGDTTWIKGKVTKKYYHNEEGVVDVDLQAVNQRDEIIAPGWASLILPSKEKSNWPLERRLWENQG